jgi:hypothetical protein
MRQCRTERIVSGFIVESSASMQVSPIARCGLLSVAVGFGYLVIVYGFDAVGEAGIQESMFRSGRYCSLAAGCSYSRGNSAEVAGKKAGRPLE